MHHPLPSKEIFLGTAQVTPARKLKSPLWPQLTLYKENDADFQNHSCIWSTNYFPWHCCSLQRGKVQWSLSTFQKKYSHQQSVKGVVQGKVLHPLFTFCITTSLISKYILTKGFFILFQRLLSIPYTISHVNLVRYINRY